MPNIMEHFPTKFWEFLRFPNSILSTWLSFTNSKHDGGLSHKILRFSKIWELYIICMGGGYFIDKYGGRFLRQNFGIFENFQIRYYRTGGSNYIIDKYDRGFSQKIVDFRRI